MEIEREFKRKTLIKKKTRFRLIGRWNQILKDKKLAAAVKKLERQTNDFSDRNLTILFGYNGATEMIEALKYLQRSRKIVTDKNIKASLWTRDLPSVDLVVRTGGEPHWSAGFMMWLVANSQLYFTETLWPDFGTAELQRALRDYSKRERRFGK